MHDSVLQSRMAVHIPSSKYFVNSLVGYISQMKTKNRIKCCNLFKVMGCLMQQILIIALSTITLQYYLGLWLKKVQNTNECIYF